MEDRCKSYKTQQMNQGRRWIIVDDILKVRNTRGIYFPVGQVSKGVCPYELLTELRKLKKCFILDGPKVLEEVNSRPKRECRWECVPSSVTFSP